MTAALRCFFCGGGLEAGKASGSFACGKCRASFRAETDPEGCVIRLEVAGCGADDCCRQSKSGHRPLD